MLWTDGTSKTHKYTCMCISHGSGKRNNSLIFTQTFNTHTQIISKDIGVEISGVKENTWWTYYHKSYILLILHHKTDGKKLQLFTLSGFKH